MRTRTADAVAGLGLHVVGWMLAILLFVLVRFFGLESVEAFREFDFSRLDRGYLVVMGLTAGAIVGLAFGLIDLGFARTRLSRLPYGKLILVQSAVHVAVLIAVLAGVRAFGMVREGESFDALTWLSRVASTNLLIVLLYTGIVSVMFNFLKQVNRKFGPGNLLKMLRGLYHRPREERRIFMFLDLQSSTSHAEKLGHVRYSQLIQDCFRDLAVVLEDRAEVYQYVGDEAVLCWELARGLEGGRCLHSFYRFDEQIAARASHYREQYGLVPAFKAGMNSGVVTVAEVGEIKREIAFHGDVLNTAARIQSKCNELERRLLVSEYLKDELGAVAGYRFEPMGTVALRGRVQPLAIFAVEPTRSTRRPSVDGPPAVATGGARK